MAANRIEGIKMVFSLLEGNSIEIDYRIDAYKRLFAHVIFAFLLLVTGAGMFHLIAIYPDKAITRNIGLGLFLVVTGLGLIFNAYLLKRSLDSSIVFTKESIITDKVIRKEIKWSELESVKCFPTSITFIGKNGKSATVNVLSKKFADFVKLIDIGKSMSSSTGKDALDKKVDANNIILKLCSNQKVRAHP